MTIKLGYCIHCGQANITCINTQKDGTMTHYSIARQGECGPLMIDDIEIPEPNWKAASPPPSKPGSVALGLQPHRSVDGQMIPKHTQNVLDAMHHRTRYLVLVVMLPYWIMYVGVN